MSNTLSVTKSGKHLIKTLTPRIKSFEKKIFKHMDKPSKKMLQSVVIQSEKL